MHSKNLRAYLDSAAGIAALLPQAERLIELRRIYSRVVPEQLLRSSSVVNYKQRQVIIFAENNAVAAKLRLLSPRLVNDFSKSGVEVTGIRLEVQPRQVQGKDRMHKRAIMSPAGAESLDQLARQLPDSRLKQVLADMVARSQPTQGRDPLKPGPDGPERKRKTW